MLDYLSNIDNPAAIGYYERRENPFHVRLELQEDIMKNLLLDNLMNELTKISSEHDNCLDETISLYKNRDYQYVDIERQESRKISIDKPIPSNVKLTKEEKQSN